MCKINGNGTTLENIHRAAKAEFLEKGYKDASLRNIVKSVGMTTGAFYGYYKSKEELFEAIVGEHYEYILKRFIKAQQEFAELPAAQQPEVMSDISGLCMYDMLHYAYEHLEECKLILCCSEGTKFAGLIDEMVDEMDVIGFKNKYDLPVVKSKCPVDGHTKRQYAKELVRQLNQEHTGAKERMFTAILNGKINGWPERILQKR